MLMSILGMSAQRAWLFSDPAFIGDANAITFTETTTVDGLTLVATSEAKLDIDANNKKVDGVQYTHRLKLNGTGKAESRNVNFDVDGPAKIEVVLMSASSSADRTLNIYAGSYEGTLIGTMEALGASAQKLTINYTGGATTIFMGSADSGINLYYISVEPLTVYSIVGDFCGGWDNDMDMVQSEDDENVYTLTIEDFVVDKDSYEYKLRSNHSWEGYQLPASGNQDWQFDKADYPHGTYDLTFTADVANHSLTLNPVRKVVTSVDIVVTDELVVDGKYVTTFSSSQPLDFTGMEGIKAYVGKKSANDWNEVEGIVLSPVEKVPANTGLLIKAEAPGTFTIPCTDQADAVDNDLVVADTDIDLYNAVEEDWGSFASGPAILKKGRVMTGIDYDTWTYIYSDAVGFIPATKPDAEGTDFLTAGSVYLPISSDEVGYSFSYVKLIFADVEMPVVENIAALKDIASGTDIILNLDATVTALSNMGKTVIQDATGGILVQDGSMFVMENDKLTGTYKTTYNSELYPQLISNGLTSSADYQADYGTAIEPEVLELEEAFVTEKVWTLVKMKDLTLSIRDVATSYGGTTKAYYISNAEGTEVELNDFVGIETLSLSGMADGDIVDVVGFPVILTEGNMYYEDLYFFSPVSISKHHTYAIVGDFFTTDEVNGWDNDQPMTQSADNENVYTLTVEGFEAVQEKYEYKLRADNQWNVYDLPMEGNKEINFGTEDRPFGTYDLTFTADVANHTLTLDVQAVAADDVFANIAALKAYDGEGGTMKLKLKDAMVTYSKVYVDDSYDGEYVNDYAVIEDASGAYQFTQLGMAALFPTGTILNGVIEINVSNWWGVDISQSSGTEASLEALETSQGVAEPLLVNDDNVDQYAEDFDWRLVKFEGVTLTTDAYDEPQMDIPVLGETYSIQDLYAAIDTWPEDGATVDVVGFLYEYLGSFRAFQPIEFITRQEEQHTYAIVGDLTGGWEEDAVMTQSEDNENVYTLTVEGFEAFAKTYEYKLRADNAWGVYELPAVGNDTYTFDELGTYTLTFTANIAENTLTLEAVKTGEFVPTYSIVGDFFTTEEISGWDNDQDMTVSGDDPNTFILVVSEFQAEAKQYYYKLRANHAWGLFELPASGNKDFGFGTDEYPAGKYNLTFTFNAADNTLSLDVKPAISTGINSVNVDWTDGNTYNLNGQRISAPVKGIVIRNGKKVVLK